MATSLQNDTKQALLYRWVRVRHSDPSQALFAFWKYQNQLFLSWGTCFKLTSTIMTATHTVCELQKNPHTDLLIFLSETLQEDFCISSYSPFRVSIVLLFFGVSWGYQLLFPATKTGAGEMRSRLEQELEIVPRIYTPWPQSPCLEHDIISTKIPRGGSHPCALIENLALAEPVRVVYFKRIMHVMHATVKSASRAWQLARRGKTESKHGHLMILKC